MKGSELATTVTEGANLLSVMLCTQTLASLRTQGTSQEIDQLIREALARYGPAFRAMKKLVRGAKEVEPALTRIDALTRFGVDYASAKDVADLRGAIRELLANLGFDLPSHAPGKGVVCELHGKRCPEAPGGK